LKYVTYNKRKDMMIHLHRCLMDAVAVTIFILSLIFCLFGGSLALGQSQKTVVLVEAMDHAFDVDAPDELLSGWTTFVLSNKMAHSVHEISLVQLPDGATHENYLTDYMSAWEVVLREFQEGVIESSGISERAKEILPDWGGDVTYATTRGLVTPGRTAERTVYMEPGNYMMVCWLKTEDGEIHIIEGMHWEFTVMDSTSSDSEPIPDSRIILHENEIEMDWSPKTGTHQFSLQLSRNPKGRAYHNNVHLVRIDEETDLDEVNDWLE
jgi:hypothetical protein